MNTHEINNDEITEIETLNVMRQMIEVSKNKVKKDGILFIVWGWTLLFNSNTEFLKNAYLWSAPTKNYINYLSLALPFLALAFTIYYLWQQRHKVQTYIGISLRYVWVSFFISLMLVNFIQFNVLQSVNFSLQHPLFMVLMAFAVTVTGSILRKRLIIFGGIFFGVLAYISSYLQLPHQLMLESFAWLVAFVIPGHILFANRKK